MAKQNRSQARQRRHIRVRRKVHGTAERPRLNVYRSSRHIYAQVIDDDAGNTFTGPDAASAIGSDCIFGTKQSDPLLEGCGNQSAAVIACFAVGCPDEVVQAAADCVAQCTQDATGLSDECVACTGDTVACGAAFCTDKCVADTNASQCIDCRCANNCIQDFDSCSGLPSDCECE